MHGLDLLYFYNLWVWVGAMKQREFISLLGVGGRRGSSFGGRPDGSESFLTSFGTGGRREAQDFPSHCSVSERHLRSANDMAFRHQGRGSIAADASSRRAGI